MVLSMDSKTKLLNSAFAEFAKNGFLGATTRDIAKNAKINISAILYYFGGKRGLYTDVLQEIVQTVKDKSGNIWERCQKVEKNGDQQEALDLLNDLIHRFLQLLCGDEISKDMKTIFFAEYSRPTAEFSILYDGLIFPVFRMMAALLTQASGGKIAIKDAYLYMFPLFSQLFVFASRQETICSFMEWSGYGKKETQKLQEYMCQQIDFLLNKQK